MIALLCAFKGQRIPQGILQAKNGKDGQLALCVAYAATICYTFKMMADKAERRSETLAEVIDIDPGETLGQWLKARRNDAGISMGQAAKMIGVGKPYISRVEHGIKVPSWNLLEVWAMLLNTPIDDHLMDLWIRARDRIIFNLDGLSVAHVKLLLLLERRLPHLPQAFAYKLARLVLDEPDIK